MIGLGATTLLVAALSPRVMAQPTTNNAASIVIFPLVVTDSAQDTVIELTNVSNSLVSAHCFYVNGALTDPQQPPGPLNPQLCAETNFDLQLTKQQPTYWVVSQGRPVAPKDASLGNDPGNIPPAPAGFTGFLACVEVDAAGSPFSGNHLLGVATLRRRTGGDVAKYAAVGLRGNENGDGNNVLCIGNDPSPACPFGAEYDGCPQTIIIEQLADGAEDPVAGNGSSIVTDLALVPCSFDLGATSFSSPQLAIEVRNEFESVLSTSTTSGCWAGRSLVDLDPMFDAVSIGSTFVQTRISPTGGSPAGVVAVSSTVRSGAGISPPQATEAANASVVGERTGGDQIVLIP